ASAWVNGLAERGIEVNLRAGWSLASLIRLAIVELEQHAVRIAHENLPEVDRDDMVLAMVEAEPVELLDHRIVARAAQGDMVDRARIRAAIDRIGADQRAGRGEM